ncbi:receptor-like protein EIX2 [Ipomoea triloba]|uniref:receptor-like protein EIX2 n=1 Tax=Ipomoea triloba TaxID=35885 RepID=UPI00125D75DD|nr:receptor-like protein EIX2 [Ipomoea triloba]
MVTYFLTDPKLGKRNNVGREGKGAAITEEHGDTFTQRVAAKNNMIRCAERERQALLDFKHGLVDDYGVLSSWGRDVHQRECCAWSGVHCHNNTGHVTMLDIHDPIYDYGFPTQQFQDNFSQFPSHPYLKGYKVSPSLLELEHLKYVDLSHIDFQGIRFPDFFSSFKRSLYLYAIDIDAPPTNVSLSPFLEKLRLPSCELHGTLPFLLNSSPFLSVVDFSYNSLTLPIFHLLHNASKQFTSIDLSHNNFVGLIPDTFGDMSILENLYLGDNSFTGETPKSFENLTHLQILSLGGNHLKESIVELSKKLSKSTRESSLQTLDLSDNRLFGELPKDIGTRFPSLRELGLRGNQLQGVLPESIGKLSMLEQLDVSSNSLQGIVSEAHFLNLANLQVLSLSFNLALSFNLSHNWVPPFQILFLLLANCKVGPQFPKWLQTQTKILHLDISYGNISDTIPEWFWNSALNFGYMNLSYNNIGGRLSDLSTNSNSFLEIDLSYNHFWGPIPLFPPEFMTIYLSNNKFAGPISSLCSTISSNTFFIDLSYNQLFGEIPDCWNKSRHLSHLDLGNNNFLGRVPHSLGSLSLLRSLHLRNNHLTGELPSSLQNCTSLLVMDLGGNEFTERIPSWIGGSLRDLAILSLRHNKFYGDIPSSICLLNRIQILDLSVNELTGKIPQCFNNFTHMMQDKHSRKLQMLFPEPLLISASTSLDNILIQWKNKEWEYRKQVVLLKSIDLSSNQLVGDIPEQFSSLNGLLSLNLSSNHLTGKIFSTIYQMENLEVLDLSKNQLFGAIPIGLASLNYLAVLDLSNNSLSGKIPTGTQLQSFNASFYAGNSGLCGDPLPKCSPDAPPQNNNNYNDYEEGDDFLDRGFYISMVLGFSLSFWGFVVTLILKDSWRLTYYEFLNDVKDWLYVKIRIYLARLQRKLRRT